MTLPRNWEAGRPPWISARGVLRAALIVYLALAFSIAWTKAPWTDEGVFANPSYNLAFRGNMGSNVVEPSGHYLNAYLSGIQERTYIVTPNHLVALAVWFRIFAFSLFSMRAFSTLWGVVVLLAVYYIASRLFPDRWVAPLGVLLTSIDFIYLWSAADGRMESFAAALALCSLAAYLHFRERRFRAAVLVSQALLAAAVFTHPNALIIGLSVFAVVWYLDRRRLRPEHLLWTALPYLIFAVLWGIYIAESPSDFQAQFLANAAGRNSSRLKGILQPWISLRDELERHAVTYILSTQWSARMNPWLSFVLPIYLGANIWVFSRWRRHQSSVRIFLICAGAVISALTFLNGYKAPHYMLYVLPFYNVILAAWLIHLWKRGGDPRGAALVMGSIFAFLQIVTTVMHIRADEYHRDYRPAVRALEKDQAAGRTIAGTAALGFGLGFDGFTDDWRLGLHSGIKPDVLLIDRSYRDFQRRFVDEEPRMYLHVLSTLANDYRLRERHGDFWIFDRVPDAERHLAHHTDLSGLSTEEKRERLNELFVRIANGDNAAMYERRPSQ